MSDLVNASPDDIKRLAAALTAYKAEVAAAGKKVQGALNSARWQDGQKAKFEGHLRGQQKQLERFMAGEVDHMIKYLSTLAARLNDIKSMRL